MPLDHGGCGAYCLTAWFQYQWPPSLRDQHITLKELLPIVIAVAIWGINWENKSDLCRCDNEAVVHIINTGTSKDPQVMGLIRYLHFIAARFNLLISATHIAGIENSLADALSRDNLPFFFKHNPQVNCSPSPIPLALLDLLVHSKPDWTSPTWSSKFSIISSQNSPRVQCDLTPPATEDTQTSVCSWEPGPSLHLNQYSVNSLASLPSSRSSTKLSNVTCEASDSTKLFNPSRPLHRRHAQAPLCTSGNQVRASEERSPTTSTPSSDSHHPT